MFFFSFVNLLIKRNLLHVALFIFIPFIVSFFLLFTEVLQVRDIYTMMCDSSWSFVYAAICAYKAKTLKKKLCLSV